MQKIKEDAVFLMSEIDKKASNKEILEMKDLME
jgi:hypothetical protein